MKSHNNEQLRAVRGQFIQFIIIIVVITIIFRVDSPLWEA